MNSGMTWLSTVRDIANSNTGDLRALAQIAGGDPEYFYVTTSLDGADIRGQDLSGMKFGPTNLENVLLDLNTKIDSSPEIGISEENIAKRKMTSIMLAKRQEERLVLAVKFLLDYPDYTKDLFLTYKENKKFALRAINNLKNMNMSFDSDRNRELAMCRFLDQELNNSFPLARGYFLRFVAVHLAGRQSFRTFLKKRLIVNFTMRDHYDLIRKILDKYE